MKYDYESIKKSSKIDLKMESEKRAYLLSPSRQLHVQS